MSHNKLSAAEQKRVTALRDKIIKLLDDKEKTQLFLGVIKRWLIKN